MNMPMNESGFAHHRVHILLSLAVLAAIGAWWYIAKRSR